MENQNIRIHLKAYDNKILDFQLRKLLTQLKELEHKLKGQFLYQQELKDIQF